MVSCLSLPWKYRLSLKTHYNKLRSKRNTGCKFHIHPSLGRKVRDGPEKTVLNHLKGLQRGNSEKKAITIIHVIMYHYSDVNMPNATQTARHMIICDNSIDKIV